jgi:hypothetical protein
MTPQGKIAGLRLQAIGKLGTLDQTRRRDEVREALRVFMAAKPTEEEADNYLSGLIVAPSFMMIMARIYE